MSILKVARMGHPVLRQRAREVEQAELKQASIQKFIEDMIDTMHEYHGVGLAAPQVHEGLRLFVATLDANDVVASLSAQWDTKSPLHVGNTGDFEYFPGLFGGNLNPPPPG